MSLLFVLSYIRCFYWATLAVATIHELEGQNPETTLEYVVELAGYLFGVFVIAVIIGEVSHMCSTCDCISMSTCMSRCTVNYIVSTQVHVLSIYVSCRYQHARNTCTFLSNCAIRWYS